MNQAITYFSLKYYKVLSVRLCFLLWSLMFLNSTYGQTKSYSKKAITAEFLYSDLEYSDMAVITNVVKIKNNNGKNYTFNVSVNLPSGWKTLNNPNKEYTLKPNDSTFVPIRLTTSDKAAKGGTKYNIAIYINTNEGKQMAYARFMAGRKKITNWQMQVLPRPRIYLLNGENSARFQVNLLNDGDEEQELLLSMNKLGKDFVLQDSSGMVLKKNYAEAKLAPYSDTTLSFNMQILQQLRNQKRLDAWSYNANKLLAEKRYGLFLRASEVQLEKSGLKQKGQKVDFIKLANNIDFVKLNNQTMVGKSSNSIPLTVFANLNNLINAQPILTLNFQGNSTVGKYSSLNYLLQTNFSYFKYSSAFYKKSLNGMLSYNYRKGYFSFGTGISSANFGILRNPGKSLSMGYFLTTKHTLSAFVTRKNWISGPLTEGTFGFALNGKLAKFGYLVGSSIAQTDKGINAFALGGRLNFPLTKLVFISLAANITQQNLLIFNKQYMSRYQANLTRNGKIHRINLGMSFNLNNLYVNQVLRYDNNSFNTNLMNSLTFKRGKSIIFNNAFGKNTYGDFFSDSVGRFFFYNNIVLNLQRKNAKVICIPVLFSNFQKRLTDNLISSGLKINFSKTDYERNFFMGFNSNIAYNQVLNNKQLGVFFTSQSSVYLRYKVWNVMSQYSYGPILTNGISNYIQSVKLYSQMFRLSLGHQYQFKNEHFIWENNPTFVYINSNKKFNLSLFSQLFYFTDNGYRFGLNCSFNLISNIKYAYDYKKGGSMSSNYTADETGERVLSKSLNISLNLKKDFAIPIPKRFRNKKFCDAKCKVFLDANGNGLMEDGEVPLENVVLRMNDFEVITDINGMGSFINMAFAKYRLQVFPLIDVGSWFPNVNDSMDVCGPDLIYIPFSKGVQVMGGVEVDRESFSGNIFEKLDISRFKIILVDTAGKTFTAITDNKGRYSFYVPYGKYTLNFDEKALGTEFYLAENNISLDLTSGVESYYHNFLIIERKRKVKRKIFGPDGKATYVEEDAKSKKSDKDDKSDNTEDQLANQKDAKDGKGKDGLAGNGKDGKNGNQTISVEAKMDKLDSLINVLNQLILRAATRIEVRTIVKQEMQDLIDELNASFTIKIDELPKGKNPSGLLLQLVRLNKVIETKSPNGSRVYTSGNYRNISDAEKFCRDYQTSGFKKARVVKQSSIKK